MKVVRTIVIILVIAGVGVGGYFGYQQYLKQNTAAAASFQTVAVRRGDLTATIGATGTVRANQSTTVTWQTSGSVDKVNVVLGDEVKDGETLAALDMTSLPQNVILAKADLVTAQRNLDNLRSSQLAKANAQKALVQAEKIFKDANQARKNLDYGRASKDQIDTARAAYLIAEEEVKRLQSMYSQVPGDPTIDPPKAQALSTLSSSKVKRDRALANMNWFLGVSTSQEINESDATLAVAKAQLADAQREWDRLKNGPDPADIAAAESRVAAIQATLRQQSIQAPFDGTVTDVKIKVGDQVSPGSVAFRLDDLTPLLVDVQVSEIDINKVALNQPVNMTFDAITGKQYTGKVIQVARVGASTQGTVNFTVTVELIDADENVRPMMTAAVNIVVSQLTDILLIPNRGVRLSDGQRITYVLQDGKAVSTNIELGVSSDNDSQLLSDTLREGDLIVLNPPIAISSPGGGMFGGGGIR